MKQTTLHAKHVEHEARMVEFGGWHMPLQYGPILEEVRRVRESCGLFDLGHMGRILLDGPDAVALAERVCTNFVARIPVGSIRYTLFCNEAGGVIDDALVYKEEGDDVFLVVNASNTDAVLEWLHRHKGERRVDIVDQTEDVGMLALQGQKAQEILARLVEDCDLADIGYYKYGFGTVCGLTRTRLSRTGYTGEDGFEIYVSAREAPRVWDEILAAGAEHDLRPIGLGARDTLRLEAGMALYGHEIDAEQNPVEAGLGFAISRHADKPDYVGRAALEAVREAPRSKLVGLTTPGPRVPRQGYSVRAGDEEIGHVCSGSVSPTLNTNIATAYVRLGHESPGTELELDVRGKRQACVVTDLPFFSRTRS